MLLLNGDCIEEMQKLIDDGKQVDSVVTDPPYHLTSIVERFGKEGSAPAQEGTDGAFARASKGFMGKEWDGGDIAFRKETWELAYKLLKPGGHLLAFSGSRTYHRMAVAIEDAGFDIRDQIMWLYGSGFPKSLNIGKQIDKIQGNDREVVGTIERGSVEDAIAKGVGYTADPANQNNKAIFGYGTETVTKGNSEWEGWGTALKPAHEPIVMARKPLSEKSIVDNVLKHRTGGINIDGCRVEGEVKRPDTNPDFRDVAKKAMAQGGQDKLNFNQITGAKRKTTVRKSRDDGNVWTDDNSGMKQEDNHFADADPRGRFPANVMHDGSDVVRDIFPDAKSVKGNPRTATIKNQTKLNNSKEVFVNHEYDDEGSASRYFYCPKTSKSERNQGLDDFPIKDKVFNGKSSTPSKDMKGVEQKFTTEPSANVHPTVKPVELMKYLCRLVTPKGGVVLDPFMGSGSTGMAAKDEGFDFIGIEKDEEYYKICESRIARFAPLMDFM